MTYLSVNVRENKAMGLILKSAFPWYRKHTVSVRFADSATIHPSHWSGGSRDEYFEMNETMGGSYRAEACNVASNWPDRPQSVERPVPENGAIVSGGMFCGKPSHFILYIRESDRARFGL